MSFLLLILVPVTVCRAGYAEVFYDEGVEARGEMSFQP